MTGIDFFRFDPVGVLEGWLEADETLVVGDSDIGVIGAGAESRLVVEVEEGGIGTLDVSLVGSGAGKHFFATWSRNLSTLFETETLHTLHLMWFSLLFNVMKLSLIGSPFLPVLYLCLPCGGAIFLFFLNYLFNF